MSDVRDSIQDVGSQDTTERFVFDDRGIVPSVRHGVVSRLVGAMRADGTPMGVGQTIGWALIFAFGLLMVLVYGSFVIGALTN